MIDDTLLKQYSYLGRGKKERFKNFDNITKLIVLATMDSMKEKYLEIHEKEMDLNKDAAEALYKSIEEYFKREYIKAAEKRSKNKKK